MISRAKVRESIGTAIFKGQGIYGGTEYSAETKKALMNAARYKAKLALFSRAYHGSPHDHSKFDSTKIGTGEGAQAYGHGLYFAENEGVARNYRDNLSGQQFGTPLVSQDVRGWLESAGGDYQKAATEAKAFLSEYGGQMGRDEEKTLREAIALMDKGKQSWGRMYEVDVNANPDDFLD